MSIGIVAGWASVPVDGRTVWPVAQRVPVSVDEAVAWRTAGKEFVVPRQAWSDKQERQYGHIKESQLDRGAGGERAEEIAARTVNKNRARSGDSDRASRTSIEDISSQRRGGLRSGKGPGGPTKAQLYNEARQKNVKGRSTMSKKQLAHALGRD
jgi:hypothetical protein